jgi:hypothetical protein
MPKDRALANDSIEKSNNSPKLGREHSTICLVFIILTWAYSQYVTYTLIIVHADMVARRRCMLDQPTEYCPRADPKTRYGYLTLAGFRRSPSPYPIGTERRAQTNLPIGVRDESNRRPGSVAILRQCLSLLLLRWYGIFEPDG